MTTTDVADVLRTLVLLIGFTLAMTCVKFGITAYRHGEGYRAWGLASYACLVLTPAIIGLYRYDEPLIIPAAVIYAVGMICGIVALRSTYTVHTSEWARMRRHRDERNPA